MRRPVAVLVVCGWDGGRVARTSSGLVCCSFGRSWWEREHCVLSIDCSRLRCAGESCRPYLEGSAETEDAVVGLLLWETLEGGEDNLGLLRDQIITSVYQLAYALSF